MQITYRNYLHNDNGDMISHFEITHEVSHIDNAIETLKLLRNTFEGKTEITPQVMPEVAEITPQIEPEVKEKKTKAKTKVAKPVEEAKVYSAEETVSLLKSVVIKKGRECALIILGKFGATKSAEIKEEDYTAVATECLKALE